MTDKDRDSVPSPHAEQPTAAMMEWSRVCQSQSCMYRVIPAVDVWYNSQGNRFYLCAECSIALGPRLRANHYTWSKLEPKDSAEVIINKEYTESE